MNRFVILTENYCPFFEKNIVIERELVEDPAGQCTETNVCLYSRDCNCGGECRNRLLKTRIQLQR